MYQVAFNIVGCAVFLPLFFVEVSTEVPLSLALLDWLTDDPELRVAWAYLLFNSSAALVLMACLAPSARLLGRIWPRTAAEDAARPRYIGDFALSDADLALELAAREQHRAYVTIAALLDPLVDQPDGPEPPGGPGRPDEAGRPTAAAVARSDSQAPRELLQAVAGFLEDLGSHKLSPRQYEHYYAELDVQGHLEALTGDLDSFAETLVKLERHRHARALGRLLGTSLHAVMHSCAESLSPDADDQEIALASELTADRAPILRGVREGYVGSRPDADEPELATVMLSGISLFERIIWRLNAVVARQGERAALVEDAAAETPR
jgi:Na+/phosphate symporter